MLNGFALAFLSKVLFIPQVNNLSLIQSHYRAFSKPYMVSFYTQSQQQQVSRSGANTAQKLVLLPFAFDVITFPFQLLEQ